MPIVLRVGVTLLILIGIIWILQGTNVLPGSVMAGHIQWAWRGAAAAILGLLALALQIEAASAAKVLLKLHRPRSQRGTGNPKLCLIVWLKVGSAFFAKECNLLN